MPDKPPGCEITDAADAGGVTLSWPAYKAGTAHAGGWFAAFWLCSWMGMAMITLVATLQGRGSAFLHFLFAVWTAAGAIALAAWRWKPVPPTPEFVRLEADALRYDPGSGPGEARSCAELPSGRVVPVAPAAAADVPKAAVRGFGIDRVNDRQRLYFDLEGRRVEIGGCLTESERAWLFDVLRRWLGTPRTAAPWSREAQRGKEEAQA